MHDMVTVAAELDRSMRVRVEIAVPLRNITRS